MKRRILFVSSEYAPYAKTGGLADAVAGLAREMVRRGHDVRVVIPHYASLYNPSVKRATALEAMCVRMGIGEVWCAVEQVRAPGGVPAYLIRNDGLYYRDGIYHDRFMHDYVDNSWRFGVLCRAALQVCLDVGFAPDIVHAHDWQAALVPAYLKRWFWNHPSLGAAASVLTIHNLAHQGVYDAGVWEYLGLGAEAFTPAAFEAFGAINLLKGGIHYADMVTTVSPTHAREVTTPYGGFGLAPFLADKGDRFVGLLNGVDYTAWSPQQDRLIPARFTSNDPSAKAVCKEALQKEFGLHRDRHACVIGAIGRFVHQKGFSLVSEVVAKVLDDMHVQFVILGSGQADLEGFFGELPARYPGRAGSFVGFSNERAHLITAGADFLVMPSLFEPCGLNQLYALRYGTLPIVRATGGLEDTVEQYDESTGGGTGFKFHSADPTALYYTIGWAVSTYYDRPAHMEKMIRAAMRRDFSWRSAGGEYEDLYELSLESKRLYDEACSV